MLMAYYILWMHWQLWDANILKKHLNVKRRKLHNIYIIIMLFLCKNQISNKVMNSFMWLLHAKLHIFIASQPLVALMILQVCKYELTQLSSFILVIFLRYSVTVARKYSTNTLFCSEAIYIYHHQTTYCILCLPTVPVLLYFLL